MSTNTEDQGTGEAQPVRHAFLFELEGTAVTIREKVFSVLKAQIKTDGGGMDLVQFVKCGLHPNPAHVVAAAATQFKLKATARETLAHKLEHAMDDLFTGKPAMDKPFEHVLKTAIQKGFFPIALSYQTDEKAAALAEKVGLTAAGTKVHCFADAEREYPRADLWLKAVRAVGVGAPSCIAIVRTATSAKTALAAGLRCVVVTDEYTSSQDFSGADVIADNYDDLDLKRIFG